jgi:adenylosuccinate lyase
VIENLIIYPDNMALNLGKLGGLHNSQRVLLALVEKGASREDAYHLVQRNAMKVWRDPGRKEGDFLRNLEADPEVSQRLNQAELRGMFDLDYHLKGVDVIFERVFSS